MKAKRIEGEGDRENERRRMGPVTVPGSPQGSPSCPSLSDCRAGSIFEVFDLRENEPAVPRNVKSPIKMHCVKSEAEAEDRTRGGGEGRGGRGDARSPARYCSRARGE